MTNKNYKHILTYARFAGLIFVFAVCGGTASAQWSTPNAYGHNTGYGTVYGTFNHAALVQSMYNVTRSEQLKRAGSKQPQQSVSAGTPKAAAATRGSGMFRPDPSVDTGRLLADALGSTPEEKTLIKNIYTATKDGYEKEAAAKGWKNNMAGGLVFFTVAAITVYHDAEEPSPAGLESYYRSVNASIDQIPGFESIPNREKQNFQNTMIGFGGMLIAVYTEGKQNNDPRTLAAAKKLAGVLIEMVLKTDVQNIKVENGLVVFR
jgi:hypothetical protein